MKKQDPTGGAITYTYDLVGRVHQIVAVSKTTIINYDYLNRRVNINDSDVGYTSYTYYDNGLIKTKYDAKGQTTTYSYDSLDRLMSEVDAVGTVNYSYDENTSYGKGRLTGVTDGNITTMFGYDSKGNTTYLKQSIDGKNFSFEMQYGWRDRLSTLTYPNNKRINLEYTDIDTIRNVNYENSSVMASYTLPFENTDIGINNLAQHTLTKTLADGTVTNIK